MKKWECTVCGYIHEGEEPPENCPICGAGKEYFKELASEEEDSSQTEKTEDAAPTLGDAAGAPSGLAALVMKHHLHPISVHTPNGVLPLGLVFLFLAIVFEIGGFEQAAFYNFVFVLLTMPVVIVTGYLEWQNRYKGVKTKIFITKIAASIVVTGSLISLIAWRLIDPAVAGSATKWIYFLICLVMVGAAGLAGHMGGKLVFDTRK